MRTYSIRNAEPEPLSLHAATCETRVDEANRGGKASLTRCFVNPNSVPRNRRLLASGGR